MLSTARMLGVGGGLFGMTMSFVSMGGSDDQGAGLLALLLFVAGIVGGGLVKRYPIRGAYLLGAGAVGGLFIFFPLGWLVLLLFAIAVFLAYRGRSESPDGPQVRTR